jgi:recombination protein RecA
MAKKKNEEDFYLQIAEQTGGELVSESVPVTYYVDTGNLALNYICSGKFITGGIPGGRITEIYGPSSSSKSLWGASILYGTQKLKGYAILLDCENALNPEFAERAGHIDPARLIRYTPDTLEKAFSKITTVIKLIRQTKGNDVPICVVYDSITVSPCEREYRETDLPEEYSDAEYKRIVGAKPQPGERAKVCNSELRKMSAVLEKNNATLLVINQTRQKIGVLFGSDETTGGGGNALEFYAACRLRTSAQKKIIDKDSKRPLGVNIKVANKKNRDCVPFIETEGVPLYFDRGINPLGGLLSTLVLDGRVKKISNGNYIVQEPYAQGPAEIKFKSSEARNDVPVEILIKCPALVDAKNGEEVKEYLSVFDKAIALAQSDEINEVDVDNENENLMAKFNQ